MNYHFNKYLSIFKISWANSFIYRLSFIMWRVRNTLALIAIYFLWSAVFKEREIFGWHLSMILTYILMSSILDSIIFSTVSFDLGYKINHGEISNLLLKPLSIFKYIFSVDVAEKLLNLIITVFEISFMILLFKPDLYWKLNFPNIIAFLLAVILSVILYFFINLLIGMIGFWTPEVWAPRFIFGIILAFASGSYFPLEFFPKPIYSILKLSPFNFLIFFPLQIFLGRIGLMEIIKGLLVSFVWTYIFYCFTKFIWRLGVRSYEAQGV